MPLAFELASAGSRQVRRLVLAAHAIGFAGVVLSAVQLADAGQTFAAASALGGGLAALAWSGRRAAKALAGGVLRVDSVGHAQHSGLPGAPAVFEPTRWFSAMGVAWIEGRAGARSVSLLLGSDTAGEADWTRLQRWLRWLDRGGARARP